MDPRCKLRGAFWQPHGATPSEDSALLTVEWAGAASGGWWVANAWLCLDLG